MSNMIKMLLSVLIVLTTAIYSQAMINSAHFKHTRILEKFENGTSQTNKFESEIFIKGDKIRQVTTTPNFTYILFYYAGFFYTYYSNKDTVNRYGDKKYFRESGKEMREKFVGIPIPPDATPIGSEITPQGLCKIYEYSTEKTEKAMNGTTIRTISKSKEWRRSTDLLMIKAIKEETKQEQATNGNIKEQKETITLLNTNIEVNPVLPDSHFKIPPKKIVVDR